MFAAALSLIACSSQPKAPVVAAGPGGAAKAAALDIAKLKETGVIYHFKAGDKIDLFAEAHGDIVTGKTATPFTLEVKRELYFYSGPGGLLLSEDGKDYQTLADFLQGQMAFALAVQKEKSTRGDLKIKALRK